MKIKVPWSNFVLVQGDDVWVATLQGPVLRINGKSGKRAAWIPVGGAAGGLAFSQGILWVADNSFAKLAKIDVQTTTVVGRVVVGKNPMILGRGVDSDGAIWVSNVDDGTVMKVKP